MGTDATTAMDARNNRNPGFDAMVLGKEVPRWSSPSGRLALTDSDACIHHFPDGNAGLARPLLRALISGALARATMEDLVTEDVDSGALDRHPDAAWLWLNSTVVPVAQDGGPATAQSVTHADPGSQPRMVSAGDVILAGWHRLIPYLATETEPEQVVALNDRQKVPLICIHVRLTTWEALAALGIDGARARGSFWSGFEIDVPASMGSYRFADTPQDPVIPHMSKVLTESGLSPREQALSGMRRLVSFSFEDLELSIRDLLQRSLGAGCVDAARRIEGITVNRWSRGFAYGYMRPWDAFWPDGPPPAMIGL